MSNLLEPIMEALAERWWGRLVIAALLFAFTGFMLFGFPGGSFDVCRFGIAAVMGGFGLWHLVTGLRARPRRRVLPPPPDEPRSYWKG